MSFDPTQYDAIYCFNVLHLFRKNERGIFLQECEKRLKEGGLMFFTVFSEKEESYGEGREVETNTFESKPGRPVHYFSEVDLRDHFRKCKVMNTGIIEDAEDHGGNPHTHLLRYICASKPVV
jgi:cyclopropane fatty-acyl-phospholipid synthase-like methyltransferase